MNDAQNYTERLRALIKAGEGCIPYMYLDTVGKVTVGVGNMLPNSDAAVALPFVDRDSGEAASEELIIDEFENLSKQEFGQSFGASAFSHFTSVGLTDDGINELLDSRIAEFETGLKGNFEDFDTYPDDAKIGIMDMAFNLGVHGLMSKFPTFVKGVKSENWKLCAEQCRRRGISDHRNEEVKELFESIA